MYYRQYKTASTNTEDNPLNIFRGAIEAGVFSNFGSAVNYGSSAEPSVNASRYIYRVIVNNSAGNWGGAGSAEKTSATRILAICEF